MSKQKRRRETTAASALGIVSVVQVDPELAEDLEPERVESAARRAGARVLGIAKGEFFPDEILPSEPGGFGLLLLDGMLLRGTSVANRPTVEVFGRGDLVRPCDGGHDPYAMVPAGVRWWALRPATLAALDVRFISRMSEHPEVLAKLAGRLWRSSGCLRLSIVQQPCLATRVHLMLWHLADRFGRVHAEGVVLPVPLCQSLLSWLVGASRPATCRAVNELERGGLIARDPEGSWLLGHERPEQLTELVLGARRVAA